MVHELTGNYSLPVFAVPEFAVSTVFLKHPPGTLYADLCTHKVDDDAYNNYFSNYFPGIY